MRLNKYVNESEKSDEGIKEVIKLIKNDCKPYLKTISNKTPFMRGIAKVKSSLKYPDPGFIRTYGLTHVRQDRMGLSNRSNTKIDGVMFFDLLNKWLRENGHADRSKSISCTSDNGTAGYFGSPFFIFPTGKFDYTYVKSPDFNEDSLWWAADVMETYLKYWARGDLRPFEAMNEFDPDRAFTTNKGINEAWKNGYEIWFQCKSYYYIDAYQNTWDRLARWF